METGLFDIPAPLFDLVDDALAGALPDTIRLILWGLVAGAGSMGLYWLTSPQKKLEQAKQDSLAARKALAAYEGDFDGIFPLMTRSLSTSFRHLGLAIGPALLGSLPVILLMVWMSGSYSYRLPDIDAQITVTTFGQTAPLVWSDGALSDPDQPLSVTWPDSAEALALSAPNGDILLTLPLSHPVPVKHKHAWWNILFANPLGSLPNDAPVDAVKIGLEAQIFVPFGPGWMQGWEALFILVVLVASVAIKLIFRIR